MQKIAKSIFFAAFAALMLTSCSASRSTINTQNAQIATLKREEYVLLNNDVNVQVKKNVFWFLFLPFGRQSEERLRERAYSKAVQSVPMAQGILNPRYDYKVRRIPLVVFTFTRKTVSIRGQAFKMKTDAQLELERNAAKAVKN